MKQNFKRILCLFAHPDDEVLGAGGTISKFVRQKCSIQIGISSTGITSKKNKIGSVKINNDLIKLRKDFVKAMKILGVNEKNLILGNFKDNENDKHSLLELIHWVESIIKKTKPDLIITHHKYCTNIDHRYLHEAVVVATRPLDKKKISVIASEIPSSTGYLKPSNFDPNLYISISPSDLKRKIKAMESYSTEKRKYPHPRSSESLRAYAVVRGVNSFNKYAEAFIIHQQFA